MRRVSSPTAPAVACETGRKLAPGLLLSRPRDSRHNSRAGHPGWLRCSSLKYSRYSRSSRLAGRAPRSGTYATNHVAGTLAIVVALLLCGAPVPAVAQETADRQAAQVAGQAAPAAAHDPANQPEPAKAAEHGRGAIDVVARIV